MHSLSNLKDEQCTTAISYGIFTITSKKCEDYCQIFNIFVNYTVLQGGQFPLSKNTCTYTCAQKHLFVYGSTTTLFWLFVYGSTTTLAPVLYYPNFPSLKTLPKIYFKNTSITQSQPAVAKFGYFLTQYFLNKEFHTFVQIFKQSSSSQ